MLLGHDAAPQGFWDKNLITDEPLDRCPLRSMQLAPPVLTAELDRHVDRYYPAYVDGYLLQAGGIADQPARYMDFMQSIRLFDDLVQLKYNKLNTDGD